MKFTIKSQHLRAVQACVAAADDPRYYFCGWHVEGSISTPEPCLVGTNGHVMTTVPIVITDYDKDAPLVTIFKPIKIGARKSEFIVTIDTIARTATYVSGKTVKTIKLVPIEATYPNWRRAGPESGWKQGSGVPAIGLNTLLLAPIQAALQSLGSKLCFGQDEKSSIRVSWLGEPGVDTYLMPIPF